MEGAYVAMAVQVPERGSANECGSDGEIEAGNCGLDRKSSMPVWFCCSG